MGVVPNHDVAEMVQGLKMYFGDHIDWEELHQFNMPELYDTNNIAQEPMISRRTSSSTADLL